MVGHKHLDEVTHDDVQIIFDSMASRGQSTVHTVHIIMNQILGNAVEDSLLARNIAHSKTLQTIMGHADIETTLDRYTHSVHTNVVKLAQINPYM